MGSDRGLRVFFTGGTFCFFLLMHVIQHCFLCRPPGSTVSEDAEIEPRTVSNLALTARRSNHTYLDFIHTWLDLIEFYLPFELAVFVKKNLFPFPLVKGKVGFAPHCLFAKKSPI
jgi:hypothetical protein